MLELRKGPPAATVLAAIKELEAKWQRPLLLVLTGGIAEDSLQCMLTDGHLATFLAAYIKQQKDKYNHAFYVLAQNAAVTKSLLSGKQLMEHLSIIEDSPLTTLNEWFKGVKFSLAIMDSSIDPEGTLAEYKAVEAKMEDGGIVIIDDVDPENKVTQKGSLIVPYLRQTAKGYQFENGMLKVFF